MQMHILQYLCKLQACTNAGICTNVSIQHYNIHIKKKSSQTLNCSKHTNVQFSPKSMNPHANEFGFLLMSLKKNFNKNH